ncbi:hypothetical protein [Gellertiella hungarica]|uniref:Outer membrane beta-barrel porin/alpha-amylase n=1 Tax=Gellertiella hungarica TaxID=1572859 RepID=A0A7W6J3N7_9HYPH|nr:hypothetical protein [Gellertiella hungarica]MBB4064185.1 hypothetical protein [Gellertiella hungarica]
MISSYRLRAAIAATATMAFAGAAQAGTAYDFSRIKPLVPVGTAGFEMGPFHDFKISVMTSYNHTWRTDDSKPLDRRARDLSLEMNFRIGSDAYAAISGQIGREDIETQPLEFPLDMDNSNSFRGFDVMAGYMFVPGISVGLMGGYGSADATYVFALDPANELGSSGNSRRFGGFANVMLPTSAGMLSGTVAIVRSSGSQTYNPGNIPPSTDWSSTLGVIDVTLAHPVTADFMIKGGASYSRILSENAAAGSLERDRDWITLKGGVLYNVTSTLQWQANASTWLGNDTNRNVRIASGFTYRF